MSNQETNDNNLEHTETGNMSYPEQEQDKDIEPYFDGITVSDRDSDVEDRFDSEPANNKRDTINDQVKENPQPSVFTWNGKRPFAGAVDFYTKYLLEPAINRAKNQLTENPNWSYAVVEIPLFKTIDVVLTDQFGNTMPRQYAVHEAHYGPLIHKKYNNISPKAHQKWMGFYDRDTSIWVKLELKKGIKLPGGDGTGRGGTECSPFRDAQIDLLKQNLFLIDSSDITHDAGQDRLWYRINIAIYRNPSPNGPIRIAHGYGYIPGLGFATDHGLSSISSIATNPRVITKTHNSNNSNANHPNKVKTHKPSVPFAKKNTRPTKVNFGTIPTTNKNNAKVWKEKHQK